MAPDGDGSIGFAWATGSTAPNIYEFSAVEMARANNEAGDLAVASSKVGPTHALDNTYGYIFPELREIDGVFARRHGALAIRPFLHSPDTTNGFGGTWDTEIPNMPEITTTVPDYRDNIQSIAASSKRAVRVNIQHDGGESASIQGLGELHIYGEIAAGETPDRLLLIDELTGLEFTLPIDYGDVSRGSSEDREFRIENNSAGLTANTIQYTAEALTGTSGSWYTVTLPGAGSFQATQSIASLAAATTTDIITLRRVTPGGETFGLHAAREYFNVDSWT
jgi:hypothetical protein